MSVIRKKESSKEGLGKTLSNKAQVNNHTKVSEVKESKTSVDVNAFTQEELEYLLRKVRVMTFTGDELSILVSVVRKIQDRHKELVNSKIDDSNKQLIKG